MDEQWELKAAEHFTRPWSQRRGIESIDRNAQVILANVSLDALSNALAEKAVESQRDVLGSEIVVLGSFAFAYQLVGHDWSVIAPAWFMGSLLDQQSGLAESWQLEQPVIELNISDTCGGISYKLFESRELVEHFEGQEGEQDDEYKADDLQSQRYVWLPYPDDDPEAVQTAYFWSRRRQVTAEEIGNIWNFANQLLLEYDAFDPAINAEYFLADYDYRHLIRGKRYRIQNQGFTLSLSPKRKIISVPDLVRVDYFRFGN